MNKVRTILLVIIALFPAACGTAPSVVSTPTAPSATATGPRPLGALDEQHSLTVGALQRGYFLHIPPGLNRRDAVPLLFFFHGSSQTGRDAHTYTGLDAVADAHGFVVVYADGSGPQGAFSWNGGLCCGYAIAQQVDEPAFVRAMLADLATQLNIDPRRIYAAGFSNGAMLSYRLACEMSDVFAAVASLAGTLTTPCQPQQPVSLLHIHGLADTVVPFDGGGIYYNYPPSQDGLDTWTRVDGCNGPPHTEQDGTVTHTVYGGCTPGIAVELYTLTGFGHAWPAQSTVPLAQMMWDFFAAHPKP